MFQSKKVDYVDTETFIPSALSYSNPKPSKVGKNIYINNNDIEYINNNHIKYNRIKGNLFILTPMMMTWGISDYIEKDKDGNIKENAEPNYSMTLNFQNDEYQTPEQRMFKEKMIAFENQILESKD